MKIHNLAPNLSMIDVEPPIPGWEEFIGVYVLKGEQVALIDVGPQSSAGKLIEGLEALKVNPQHVSHILLTHIHLDHAGAVGGLLGSLPNARVVVHPKGVPHLVNPGKLWEASINTLGDMARQYGRPHPVPPERIIAAEDGSNIALGDKIELEAIYTPGHAAHHLSFLEAGSGMLFAGETCGVYLETVAFLRPSTPPPLILEQALASIDRLLERNPGTVYFGHFGSGGDARLQLSRHKGQLQLWRTVIGEALGKGIEEPEAILSKLLARDPFLKNLEKLPQAQYQRERFLMLSGIKGFLGDITQNQSKRRLKCANR